MSEYLPIVINLETKKQIILNTEPFVHRNNIILESTLVSGKLNIHLNSNLSRSISFKVYNVLGQKLMEHSSTNSEYISLDMNTLSNGIYYLRTNLPASRIFKFLKTS